MRYATVGLGVVIALTGLVLARESVGPVISAAALFAAVTVLWFRAKTRAHVIVARSRNAAETFALRVTEPRVRRDRTRRSML